MRPDLLRFQLMQQMQQQQQAQQQNPQALGAQPTQQQMQPMMPNLPPRNPIADGAGTGIEAARRSLQMNKDENSRALGRAMMHFFSGKNLPAPGSGLAGALGTVNASFLPAMQQYDAERDRIAKENFALMQHEEEMRRHAAKEEEQRAHFEEMRRLHDAQIAHYQAQDDRLAEGPYSKEERERDYWADKEKDLPLGTELIEKYRNKPSEWRIIQNDVQDAYTQAKAAKQGMKITSRMKDIIKDHPTLYNKMDVILLNKYNTDPSLLLQKAIEAKVPTKDVAAFQELSKLTADLFALQTKLVPAKGINMFMEKQIRQKIPDARMVPHAFNKIADRMYTDFREAYAPAEEKVNLAKKGIWKKNELMPLEDLEGEIRKETNPKNLSEEDLDAQIAALEQELGSE